jgi:sigma-B regulation protein RsbU (phosphoserine phosphatase)
MVLLWLRFPNYVNGKRLEQQTELARRVQMDLLPPSNLEIAGVDIAAQCVPAWQVGGDFYDVFSAPDGRVAIAVGDVSGKGLPASMVVGLLLGAVRASNWMAGKEEHESSTARLSELIRSRTAIERFVSLFWCYYEPDRRTLRYVNAGHLPPMLIGQDERGNPVVRRLEEGGPVLGVLVGARYEQGEADVRPGEVLVMYSDGVVEAANAAGAQFEEEGLLRVVLQHLQKPCTEIRDEVLRAVHEFMGEERAQDDITLVVARFLEKGAGGGAG